MASLFGSTNGSGHRGSAKIVVVDDHPLFRRGIISLINESGRNLEVVGIADGLTDALAVIKTSRPDLALVDISLRDSHGIELIKHIRAMSQTIKLLVLSTHPPEVYASRAVAAGADGYLNKEQDLNQVLDAIFAVLHGDNMSTHSLKDTDTAKEPSRSRGPAFLDGLTDRELEVFELMGQGLTTLQVAERLYLSPKTVETYRANLKEKLATPNTNALIALAARWISQDL